MMKIVTLTIIALLAVGCGGGTDRSKKKVAEFYATLDAGSISEAKSMLFEIEGEDLYRCAEALIEEYITIGDVRSAVSVYERNTPDHCSTYQMQYSMYTHNGYENRVTKLLYEALIENDDFEAAWKYHPLRYDDPDYAGNGADHFGYITDVLFHLCQQGRTLEAQQFLDKHTLWFKKNVDNGEFGSEYPDFYYSKVVGELQTIINKR